MALSFEYKIDDPADYALFLRESQEQARLNFHKIREAFHARYAKFGPEDDQVQELQAMLSDKELLVSEVMNTLADQGHALAGWQVLTETQARRILRGLRDKAGRRVHPNMPGSQPPAMPRSDRPTSVGRPTSNRPTMPSSAGTPLTTEEAVEILRRLYPQFVAEVGGSSAERLRASHGRY